MIDRVDSILNSSVLPDYTPPPLRNLVSKSAEPPKYCPLAGCDHQDKIDLHRMKLSTGYTCIDRYLYVHVGETVKLLWNLKELAVMNIALIVVLEQGHDSCQHRSQLIGTCSRLDIEGVVVDVSTGFDTHLIPNLAKLVKPYAHDDNKSVLVCRDEGDETLNKVLVELLAYLRDYSQFEAQLDVCRRAVSCK